MNTTIASSDNNSPGPVNSQQHSRTCKQPNNSPGPVNSQQYSRPCKQPNNSPGPVNSQQYPRPCKQPNNSPGPVNSQQHSRPYKQPNNSPGPVNSQQYSRPCKQPNNFPGPVNRQEQSRACKQPNNYPGPVNSQQHSRSCKQPNNSRGPEYNNHTFLTPRRHCYTNFATFNVRTLSCDTKLSILARTLNEYKIAVCGLTEVRRLDSGSISVDHPDLEHSSTLLWSGQSDIHQHGVGLLISAYAKKCLSDWSPISSRIIRARFNTPKARLSIICAYTPTLVSHVQAHEECYDQLESKLDKIPVHDMILVLGDFNAHIGTSRLLTHSGFHMTKILHSFFSTR